jgi:hypothetical protein
MEYVFPVPKWLRYCLLKQKRLYAFPVESEEKAFILLFDCISYIHNDRSN